MRLTVAQALVRFLSVQSVERDGQTNRFFAGCFGIFGHGNVAGLGEALLESGEEFPYYLARNEQAMVHTAVGYARMSNRLRAFACTTSVGPGATNLVTGAAVATTNRIPVLLLPGDVFATRRANPVLQELEDSASMDVSVNDSLRPVSKYFDRIWRPEQLPQALLHAMRVLTDPAETGAVTLALPEDVQTESFDFPDALFAPRVWVIRRPPAEARLIGGLATLLRESSRPLIVAGGGVIYAGATDALDSLVSSSGVPVAETQAGKGSLRFDHPASLGAIGATGTTAANEIARNADLVIGIGTRWSDFTTASNSVFQDPAVKIVNINVTPFDTTKLSGAPIVADAREALAQLAEQLDAWHVDEDFERRYRELARQWNEKVDASYALGHGPLPGQSEVIGAVEASSDDHDVVVAAAGSLPGDLHKLWRTRDPKGYHVEYGYSCMGYEIAGGWGARIAQMERDAQRVGKADTIVLVGDGSYLLLNSDIYSSVLSGRKLIIILCDNGGFAVIDKLQRATGNVPFNNYIADSAWDHATFAVDFPLHARSMGALTESVTDIAAFEAAFSRAKSADRTCLIDVKVDPYAWTEGGHAWWEVGTAEVSKRPEVLAASKAWHQGRDRQRRGV